MTQKIFNQTCISYFRLPNTSLIPPHKKIGLKWPKALKFGGRYNSAIQVSYIYQPVTTGNPAFRTSAYMQDYQNSSLNFQNQPQNIQLLNHLNNMNVVESGTATIRRRTSTRMPASMMAVNAGQHPFLIRRTPSVHSSSSAHLRHNSGSVNSQHENMDAFSVISSGANTSVTSPNRNNF